MSEKSYDPRDYRVCHSHVTDSWLQGYGEEKCETKVTKVYCHPTGLFSEHFDDAMLREQGGEVTYLSFLCLLVPSIEFLIQHCL